MKGKEEECMKEETRKQIKVNCEMFKHFQLKSPVKFHQRFSKVVLCSRRVVSPDVTS